MTIIDDFSEGDPCPVHGSPHRKIYRFGSTMSAETDVCTFKGCPCAVAVMHDPVCCLPSEAHYFATYAEAHGHGKLRAAMAAVKYR